MSRSDYHILFAIQKLKKADHLLDVASTVSNERLLISAIKNISLAASHTMKAILVSLQDKTQDTSFYTTKETNFSNECSRHHLHINKIYLKSIERLELLINTHNNATTEFIRKGTLIICDNNYNCLSLNETIAKRLLHYITLFVYRAKAIINIPLHELKAEASKKC